MGPDAVEDTRNLTPTRPKKKKKPSPGGLRHPIPTDLDGETVKRDPHKRVIGARERTDHKTRPARATKGDRAGFSRDLRKEGVGGFTLMNKKVTCLRRETQSAAEPRENRRRGLLN